MALPLLALEEYERMKALRDEGIKAARGMGLTFMQYVNEFGLDCIIPWYVLTSDSCVRCRVLFPATPELHSCPNGHYSTAGFVRRWNKLIEKYEIDNKVEVTQW